MTDGAHRRSDGRPIRLLVFDLGGVLVENAGFDRLRAWLGAEAGGTVALRARWLASPAVRAFERGATTAAAFAQRFVDEWSIDRSPASFIEEFVQWPTGFYPGAEEFLARRRRQCATACLTNSNALHWQRFDGFREHFDHRFSSHLTGVVKPEPSAFAHVLDTCGVAAEDTAFFDDSEENVDAARCCGMRAFHVVGFPALAALFDRVPALRQADG